MYRLTPTLSAMSVDDCCSGDCSSCSEILTEDPLFGLIVANLSSSVSADSVGSLWTTMILKPKYKTVRLGTHQIK